MFRRRQRQLEFFLAHPGGPLAQGKDAGHWTIPKGEPEIGEDLLETARREFTEETGIESHGPYILLGSIRQKGGKSVYAWAFEHSFDGLVRSNTYQMEWPPGSGTIREFPEVDRAEYFPLVAARKKIKATQFPLLERLALLLEGKTPAKD